MDSGRFEVHGYSNEWFDDLKKNYGDLEKKVGFDWQDYKNWLAERKQIHNISNLILFTDWVSKREANDKRV